MSTHLIQPEKIRVRGDCGATTTLEIVGVARIAQALIEAAADNDTRRGIALLAQALGCKVEGVGRD